MVTIREKLKKSKIIFKLWTKYHNCKLKKVNERKTDFVKLILIFIKKVLDKCKYLFYNI